MYAKILLMTAVLLSGQVYAQSATPTTPVVKTKAKKKKKAAATAAIVPVEAVAATTTAPVVEVKKEEVTPVAAVKAEVAKVGVINYIKEHFSATYHGEYSFVRRDVESTNDEDHKIKDFKLMHNPTLIYKPTKDWQILSTAEFKYSDQPETAGASFTNSFYRALFTITRKNILTEKEHGIQLDAGIGRRQFNTKTNLDDKGYPVLPIGNDRAFTTITKNVGKHSGSLFLQYLYDDVKRSKNTTWKHSLEIVPTITLQLTDKLSYMLNDDIIINTPKGKQTKYDTTISHEMNVGFVNFQVNDKINTYYQLKYYHTDAFEDPRKNDDYMEHFVGVGYAFTPKITITAEVGNEIIHSNDRRDFFGTKAKYPELTIYLDAAL